MQVFRSFGAQLLSVPWDGTGPRAEVFERLLERHTPKLFYRQPSAHNPTGLAVAPETARRLLDAAARHQVPIVEDGFDGSLFYGDAPTLAAQGGRPRRSRHLHRHVLEDSVPGAERSAGSSDRRRSSSGSRRPSSSPTCTRAPSSRRRCTGSASASSSTATRTRVATEYARRRSLLLAALRRRMPSEVTWTEPQGGFSLLVTLPSGVDAGALVAAGDRAGRRLRARRALLRGWRRPAYSTAVVLVGGGQPHRRGNPASRRNDQSRARPASWPERAERGAVPVV